MALSTGTIYEPQHRSWGPSQRNGSLVLRRKHLSTVEESDNRFVTLDPWKTCAMFYFFPDIISCRIIFVAGSGKSVLWFVNPCIILSGSPTSSASSAVIEDIATMCKPEQASMAYFYFDFRNVNEQHPHDLISSFLSQLSTRSHPRYDILSTLYKTHDSGKTQPSDLALVNCLKQMFSLPGQHPIYLVMDALDECPDYPGIPSPRGHVLQLVKEFVTSPLPNLHICVTSRPEVDIRNIIQPLTSLRFSLHDQPGQKQDISNFLKSIVYSDSEPFMSNWEEKDKDSVVKALDGRADGM